MLPRLHVVTDDAVLATPDFAVRAAQVLAAGGARIALHVRGRRTPALRLFALAQQLHAVAAQHGAMLIVNERVDVALAVGAHGVQLGIGSIPVPDARSLLGTRLIGYSAHAVEEAVSAVRNGADHVLLGTIWETPSHPGVRAAGVALVRAAARETIAPLIGIGGVTPERVAALRSAGAYGAAVLGGVWQAPEPMQAVAQYLNAIAEADASATSRES